MDTDIFTNQMILTVQFDYIQQGQLKLRTLIPMLDHGMWSLQMRILKKFVMLCRLMKLGATENLNFCQNMPGIMQIPPQIKSQLWKQMVTEMVMLGLPSHCVLPL